jgi:hypothetical protein
MKQELLVEWNLISTGTSSTVVLSTALLFIHTSLQCEEVTLVDSSDLRVGQLASITWRPEPTRTRFEALSYAMLWMGAVILNMGSVSSDMLPV